LATCPWLWNKRQLLSAAENAVLGNALKHL